MVETPVPPPVAVEDVPRKLAEFWGEIFESTPAYQLFNGNLAIGEAFLSGFFNVDKTTSPE